jgi:hypothetical protein
MLNENPMLQTKYWTREAMAVAQDWELERGNEGALIWTDLGPDLARMVCENPEVLGMLAGFVIGSRASWTRAGTWAWIWAKAEVWMRARAGTWTWAYTQVRARAYAGNNYA